MTFVVSFGNFMAYSLDEMITGQTGSIGLITLSGAPNLSQLFTGTPQFYAGSLIQIEEILTIVTSIDDASLVDVDYRWFSPRKYLGTYQLINTLGLLSGGAEEQGNLFTEYQEIKRYSWYTVVANPAKLVNIHEQLFIENCNYYTEPAVYVFPDEPVPRVGSWMQPNKQPVFIGGTTISRAPLLDKTFNQKIYGVGLFLNAGVSGIRVSYKAGIINTVSTDYEQYTAPSCLFAANPTCQQQFNAFLASADPQFSTSDTLAGCQATATSVCSAYTYFCPTDPTQQFTYYQSQGSGST